MQQSPLLSFLILFATFVFSTSNAQHIRVDTKYTADDLVRDIFIGNKNTCLTVSNVSVTGWNFGSGDSSYGYFDKNGSNFEINEGIILSSGIARLAEGQYAGIQSADDSGWKGDQDLEQAAGIRNTTNATILEFDFISNLSNKISFDYMFLSEQYLRNNDPGTCGYTDAFAFLIRKDGDTDYTNLAVIPNTQTPITSNNVRGSGGKCPASNEEYFGHFNLDGSETNFNGQTKILTAITDVVPGTKYHIKLVIADQGNGLYDSGVFLKAGSFVGNKDLGPDKLLAQGTALCRGTSYTINTATPGGSNYKWYKDGILITGANSANYTVTQAGYYEVEFEVSGCKLKGTIIIEYADKPILQELSFCNYNDGNPIEIKLSDYNSQIITNLQPYFSVKYYDVASNLLPDNWSYTNDTTIYVHVESGNCTIEIKPVHFKTAKRSTSLGNPTICPTSTTTLDAGLGFKYYKWTNENGDIIDEGSLISSVSGIGPGKYFVELTNTNDCIFKQEITVFAAETPIINYIDVQGSTATVYVSGGTPPYEYSIDNINFQSSNVFTNVPRGMHTVYVKAADGCEVVQAPFLVLNLVNVITPNGDGYNDVLDYSDLSIKNNVSIKIFDSYGTMLFQSEGKNYIWNGKYNGRPVSTGTYWYLLNWEEPGSNQKVNYTGWILVKNRN